METKSLLSSRAAHQANLTKSIQPISEGKVLNSHSHLSHHTRRAFIHPTYTLHQLNPTIIKRKKSLQHFLGHLACDQGDEKGLWIHKTDP